MTKPELDEALEAASNWLVLADAKRYAETWNKASARFRGNVTQDAWVDTITRLRSTLGDVQTRELDTFTYTHELPKLPIGEYVVVSFKTVFAAKSQMETVSAERESDRKYRIVGYFVKD